MAHAQYALEIFESYKHHFTGLLGIIIKYQSRSLKHEVEGDWRAEKGGAAGFNPPKNNPKSIPL